MTFATIALLVITLATLAALVWRAVNSPHLARIGARNVLRRMLRTALIVFGLMLATTLITTALAVNDTLIFTVKSVANASVGLVDESITGGTGSLGLFASSYYDQTRHALQGDARVADIAGVLTVNNTLMVDQTSRQAHGGIFTLGMDPQHTGKLTALQRQQSGGNVTLAALATGRSGAANEAYLNSAAGQDLDARAGDTIAIFSPYWPQQRYQFRVRAILDDGPLGERPTLLLPLAVMQGMVRAPNNINHIYIANAGTDLTSVDYSSAIAAKVQAALPHSFTVDQIKASAMTFALSAQDIFGHILFLYTLFALAIDLLLIFLIFTLLAAERRSELGAMRAIGMHRSDVVEMFLFEAGIYDTLAATPGALSGIGLGVLIILIISPEVAHFGFPLRISLDPQDIVVALCLGFLFTLAVTMLAAAVISRMTIAAALRDQPEPQTRSASLPELWGSLLSPQYFYRVRLLAYLRAGREFLWGITWRGMVPAVTGIVVLSVALAAQVPFLVTAGLAGLMGGMCLLARWIALLRITRDTMHREIDVAHQIHVVNRIATFTAGGIFVLYWALPLDPFQIIGLPRFNGGIEIVFTAGVMMVFGAVLAITPNLDLLLAPLKRLFTHVGRLRHVTFIALVYPAYQRFRTSVGLALFSLVCFTMVVMACVAASTTQHFSNLNAVASDYDIIGQPLFTPFDSLDQMRTKLSKGAPATAADLTAVSSASSLPIGVIQPDAPVARWQLYPIAAIQGDFLNGVGLPLVARAQGFQSDADVWNAVRMQPGNVVIDVGALQPADIAALGAKPPPPVTLEQYAAPPIASALLGPATLETVLNRPDVQDLLKKSPPEVRALLTDPAQLQAYSLKLSDVLAPDHTFKPTKLWLADFRGGEAHSVTVVGLVDNAYGQRYGLLGSPQTFAPIEDGLPSLGNAYYYFQLKANANAQTAAHAIGSALLDNGFETTVIHQALLDLNAPRVFASKVIERLVSLMLLVGTAALMVTGMRSVVERRQQIGMLRALGFHQLHIQALFVLESLFVAASGAFIGLILGVALCSNAFAADVFQQSQATLALVIPWNEIAVIEIIAVAAALIAVALPAWQAGRITPAEALHYE